MWPAPPTVPPWPTIREGTLARLAEGREELYDAVSDLRLDATRPVEASVDEILAFLAGTVGTSTEVAS